MVASKGAQTPASIPSFRACSDPPTHLKMAVLKCTLKRVPAILEYRDDFDRTRHYTLYETPDEGLKVYELETVREGSMERQPGQRAAELREVAGRLFTAEELRKERPEIAHHLLGTD